MTAANQDPFARFDALNAKQQDDADAIYEQAKARMTDEAFSKLVAAGIVDETASKESAARIVSGIMSVAKVVTGALGVL